VTSRTYIDIHILHTVPPSCVNRDDAGSPKQAIYGGARRARVSSQAWKRAARTAFAEHLPKEQLATRTKQISTLLANRIADRVGLPAEEAARLASKLLDPLGIKTGKKKESDTAYLLFFGLPQLERIVDLVADRAAQLAALDDKTLKEATKTLPVKEQLGTGHPIDVALFGRMVADIPDLNVDAATQVAHAISTHSAEIEFDYYTAVDDENPREETGAGMIGTVEFTSATFYRYATVELRQLLDNLGGDSDAATTALRVFLDTFARSMPSGHENTFAHRTLPSLVSVAVRDDQPVNLVSAFEEPVRGNAGIVAKSELRLAEEMRRAATTWGLPPRSVASTYTMPSDDRSQATLRDALGEPVPFAELVSAVADAAQADLAAMAV
jgi:CRISPR system Cascade subunit CasC